MELVRLAGIEPMTTVEWPGRLSAVLFLQGCPWRCRYCHNSALVALNSQPVMTFKEALELLARRRGFLDSVVFSGGEPTMQPGLAAATDEVRGLGYEVALHTNGYDPEALREVLQPQRFQMVAMDIKAPFDRYEQVTRAPGSGRAAAASVAVVIASGVPHEFRTTYHSALLRSQDLRGIGADLHAAGAERYVLQAYRSEGCPDMGLCLEPSTPPDPAVVGGLRRLFGDFALRGFTDPDPA